MKHCTWCGKEIDEATLTNSTHGLCTECFQKFQAHPRKSQLLAGAAVHHRANHNAKLLDEAAPVGTFSK